MKTLAILLAVIAWGKINHSTNDVDYYIGDPKSDAEMRADGWKEVVETRDACPVGSLADYKYVWQPTAWVETSTTLSRNWQVRYCEDITQVVSTTNEVVEANKEVAK